MFKALTVLTVMTGLFETSLSMNNDCHKAIIEYHFATFYWSKKVMKPGQI